MCAKASVSAPAIRVVVGSTSAGVVSLLMSSVREVRIEDSICANCGYLFAECASSDVCLEFPFVDFDVFEAVPLVVVVVVPPPRGRGYSHAARFVWAASTATWFSFPKARCALMKTRILAIAVEIGSVDFSAAQARGFVSITTVSSEGVWPWYALMS